MNHFIVDKAEEKYTIGQIIRVKNTPMVIYLILGNNVFLRHLTTFEWTGFQLRKLMKKIGL